jgi:Protein of unknown function (DUF3618)
MGKDPAAIRQEIEQTRSELGDTMEAIGYKTDVGARAEDYVSEKKEAVVGAVQETVHGAKDAIVSAKDAVVGKSDDTASRVGEALPSRQQVASTARKGVGIAKSNPLGLAIGAASLGFLAGMLIPSTRVEDEKLGTVADNVKEQAKETGQEALERTRTVAQEALHSATETARDRGRAEGEDLASNLKERAQTETAPETREMTDAT